jgi:hypothetical protein
LLPHKGIIAGAFVTGRDENYHEIKVANRQGVEGEIVMAVSEALPADLERGIRTGSNASVTIDISSGRQAENNRSGSALT